MSQPDDYDLFLENWVPSERLTHACLPQYLNDILSHQRVFEDSSGVAPLARTPFAHGPHVMASAEAMARSYGFFERHQSQWAAEFRDYVLSKGVREDRFGRFVDAFVNLWVDGRSLRQNSPEMLAIKASIRDFDNICYPAASNNFVINAVIDDQVQPIFNPYEMAMIFEANQGLLQAFMPSYLDHLNLTQRYEGPGSLSQLYVRRGVFMPTTDMVRRELHYLSSYSLTLGPVEQFAQTIARSTRTQGGTPSIFSAPLSAIQDRVVAFAPFIAGMSLAQLELVIAPPTASTPLQSDGVHDGIHEFSFR